MRSLTEEQWDKYFRLIEELGRLPAEQRRAALDAMRSRIDDREVLALAELHLGLAPEVDRCRSGERIRSFVLGEPIGRGGMGVVYLGVQEFANGIQREVAIKLIHPERLLGGWQHASERFRHEIGILAALEHPGIARIYDGGSHCEPGAHETTLFIAMELVRGEPLTQYVDRNRSRLGVSGVLRSFLKVCDAVIYAHRQGVVHRDLKPSNILVDAQGQPRIIDFGLAHTRNRPIARDGEDVVGGTPGYVSPEQTAGGPIGPSCDVYSLGVILCELLTGHRPSRSSAAPALPVLRAALGEGYDDLARTLAKATSSALEDRHASVAALGRDLIRCLKTIQAREQRALEYRRFLIRKVEEFWIEGVLKGSLYAAASMELGLALRPQAVERPWDLILQPRDQLPRLLPPGTRIDAVFRDLGCAMLVLGSPGSGKTTLMLELARELLAQAKQDAARPIPCIFHLSTWAEERRPMIDWLADELDRRYDLPARAAQECLASARLLVLLDGLDEVAPGRRAECVEAINALRKQRVAMPLVVCSRSADYDALSVRLRLGGAVVIQPLVGEQIDGYLQSLGPALTEVRAAVSGDAQLRRVIATPLMLSIAIFVCRGQPQLAAPAATLDERRAQLFDAYTRAMFERRSNCSRYSPAQTLQWLGWLAGAMLRHHQSVLYLEWMQPNWLARAAQRWTVGPGSVVFCGALVGVVVGFGGSLTGQVAMSMPISLAMGLLGGLVFGLLGYGDQLRPITRLRWSWTVLREQLVRKLAVALGVGAFLGAGVALVFHAPVGAAIGAATTLAFCYFGGLDFELIRSDASRRSVPNEGVRRSARYALVGSAGGALAGGLVGGLAGGVSGAWFGASLFGLIVAMMVGLHPCLQHLILRLFLWRNGSAPLNYVRFLDHAVERIFLHRVGGGYAFVHRELLEHFAQRHRPRRD